MDENNQPVRDLPQEQVFSPEPDPREAAYRKILGPAIALIITAGIGILFNLLSIALSVFQARLMNIIPDQEVKSAFR